MKEGSQELLAVGVVGSRRQSFGGDEAAVVEVSHFACRTGAGGTQLRRRWRADGVLFVRVDSPSGLWSWIHSNGGGMHYSSRAAGASAVMLYVF